MATYYIQAIKYDNYDDIEAVKIDTGDIETKEEVVDSILNDGHIYKSNGEEVRVVVSKFGNYLRIDNNTVQSDNIGILPRL